MYHYHATVANWIDGDTLLLEIDLGFYVTRFERVRLARINTPEMNSEIPFRRRKARHARAVGKKFCPLGTKVVIHTTKGSKDMYGKYLEEVTYNGQNLSDYLIEKKVGRRMKY
jgi:micrococcal nuclease